MTTLISEAEVIQFLKWIEDGTTTLKADIDPQQIYAGDVTYTASNGWRITIFNDANEWDYVDSVVASDGRTLSFDEIYDEMLTVSNYEPSADIAWTRYGIPGYCIFRCEACGVQLSSKTLSTVFRIPPFLCERCRETKT